MDTSGTKTQKTFCVGFHKTASTSVAVALETLLGTRVCGPVGHKREDLKEVYRQLAFEVIDDYDIFKDNPWAIMYKELDERVPGSRFILTERDPQKWLKSVVRHFGGNKTLMREIIYGDGMADPVGHEDVYLARYVRHCAEVKEYFKGRKDFLIMNVDEGDGWEKLCAFLGKPVPADTLFPSFNVGRTASDTVLPSELNKPREVAEGEKKIFEKPGYDIVRLPYGKKTEQ